MLFLGRTLALFDSSKSKGPLSLALVLVLLLRHRNIVHDQKFSSAFLATLPRHEDPLKQCGGSDSSLLISSAGKSDAHSLKLQRLSDINGDLLGVLRRPGGGQLLGRRRTPLLV